MNRTGVAGAVLQTLSSLIHSFIHSLTDAFPPDLQKIINPKPLELETWHFERMFTPHHVLHVICHLSYITCHVSPVTSHMSFFQKNTFFLFKKNRQSGGTSRWRVCFQRGLPRLVFLRSTFEAKGTINSIYYLAYL